MSTFFRLISINLLLFGILFQIEEAQAVVQNACTVQEIKEITLTVAQYLKQHTAISPKNVKVSAQKCMGGYALAKTIPLDESIDPAFVYLHKIKDHWQVMALGTYFDQPFLNQVPTEIRDYTKSP